MTDSNFNSDTEDAIRTLSAALRDGRLTINALGDGSGVLLDLEREQLMTLNATGMCVVQAIESGAESPAAVVDALVQRFEVAPDTALRDQEIFFRQLESALSG